jgi:hypothetical protein
MQLKMMMVYLFIITPQTSLASSDRDTHFKLAKQLVIKDDPEMLALPYAVANLLIEVCYGSSDLSQSIECPDEASFNNLINRLANDEQYHNAVSMKAGVEALAAHMEGQPQDKQEKLSSSHQQYVSSNQKPLSAHAMYERSVADRVSHYKSARQVFARIVQGLFLLNLDATSASEIAIDQQTSSFLAKFTHQDGTPVFSASLGRLSAAREINRLGLDHQFLLQEDAWVVKGEKVEWENQNTSMVSLYFTLYADVVESANEALLEMRPATI